MKMGDWLIQLIYIHVISETGTPSIWSDSRIKWSRMQETKWLSQNSSSGKDILGWVVSISSAPRPAVRFWDHTCHRRHSTRGSRFTQLSELFHSINHSAGNSPVFLEIWSCFNHLWQFWIEYKNRLPWSEREQQTWKAVTKKFY